MGDDGFDGTVLKVNVKLADKVLGQLAQCMNLGYLPSYLTCGRLVPLSKKKGEDVVEISDVRPIVVRSHLSKIVEKAILKRIQVRHSHLVATGRYQTGFQQSKSTLFNLADLIDKIAGQRRRRSARQHTLFVDLQQAYNSVSRAKLRECLVAR